MAKTAVLKPFLAVAKDKFTINTIEDMIGRRDLALGDVVELNGYYTAGDGAGHKRKIEATDDGSGILLANGLWANIVHNGEVNVSWFGAEKYIGSDLCNNAFVGSIEFPDIKNKFKNIIISRSYSNYNTYIDYKKELGSYPHDVFISEKGSTSGNGEDRTKPITMARFFDCLNSNTQFYEKNSIIAHLLDDVISTTNYDCYIKTGKRILFKSMSTTQRTLITNSKTIYELDYSILGNIIRVKNIENKPFVSVFDFSMVDKNNISKPLINVKTLDECTNTAGSYFVDIDFTYIRPLELYTKIEKKIRITFGDNIRLAWNVEASARLFFENIDFLFNSKSVSEGCVDVRGSSESSLIVFNNCTSTGGNSDGFRIQGMYSCLLNKCVSAYSPKDCFNYHSASENSMAIEINCIGYGAGMYKNKYTNQTTHSNNSTTAHDGMKVYRFGSLGYNCEGPVLADVDGCLSVNYDCKMFASTTKNGVNASYYTNGKGKSVFVNCLFDQKNNFSFKTEDINTVFSENSNVLKSEVRTDKLEVI